MKITIEIDEGKCAIFTDADNKYNRDPSEVEAEDDDHIRFGDIVGFKTLAGDVTTGIVINIRDGTATILYQNIYDDRLSLSYKPFSLSYKPLEDLRRLKITYSEITEDVMEWLTT